jgi:hypothetical protein
LLPSIVIVVIVISALATLRKEQTNKAQIYGPSKREFAPVQYGNRRSIMG